MRKWRGRHGEETKERVYALMDAGLSYREIAKAGYLTVPQLIRWAKERRARCEENLNSSDS